MKKKKKKKRDLSVGNKRFFWDFHSEKEGGWAIWAILARRPMKGSGKKAVVLARKMCALLPGGKPTRFVQQNATGAHRVYKKRTRACKQGPTHGVL